MEDPVEEIQKKIRRAHAELLRLSGLFEQIRDAQIRGASALYEAMQDLGKLSTSGEAPILIEGIAPLDAADVLMTFPCDGKVKEFHVTTAMVAEYQELYPSMDVEHEFRKMMAWIKANPAKKKTARGMPIFINRWIDNAQNRNRFEQRQQSITLRAPRELAPYEREGYASWDEWRAALRTSLAGDDLERALFKVEEEERKWTSRTER